MKVSLAMKPVWIAICAACGATRVPPKPALPTELVAVRVPCSSTPPRVGELRHATSHVIAALGAHHRGQDLVSTASAATQTIEGWITYGPTNKSLEDEDAEVFACIDDAWHHTGTARTDRDGHFALALAGEARLPIGMRDLYLEAHDGTGARFLALVAADDTRLVVSDVDGTLTSSENAFVKTVVFDRAAAAQAGAAAAYRAAAARGFQLVYVTARGNRFTAATRAWLEEHGFPRGPLRLAPEPFTLPGAATLRFKKAALAALPFAIAAAVGNRASDIAAYRAAGIAPDRIYIKLPEYDKEVRGGLAAGAAIGFDRYDDLRARHIAVW